MVFRTLTRSHCHGQSPCGQSVCVPLPSDPDVLRSEERRKTVRKKRHALVQKQSCFTSAETVRGITVFRDGEHRTTTSTFAQLLSSDALENCFILHTSACVPVPVPSTHRDIPCPAPPPPPHHHHHKPRERGGGESGGGGGRFGSVCLKSMNASQPDDIKCMTLLTPFTAPAGKKFPAERCTDTPANSIFSGPVTSTFNASRFRDHPFTCQYKKENIKA